MQMMYGMIRDLGVPDSRVFSESFGPSSSSRRPDKAATDVITEQSEADNAVVTFANSKFEQPWTPDEGALLEFTENHGVAPTFGCRNGNCSTCAIKLKFRSVSYRVEPSAAVEEDEVLICCSVPAKGMETLKIER